MSLDAILSEGADYLEERVRNRMVAIQFTIDAGCHKTYDEEGRIVSSVELLIDAANRLESYFEALLEEEENDE